MDQNIRKDSKNLPISTPIYSIYAKFPDIWLLLAITWYQWDNFVLSGQFFTIFESLDWCETGAKLEFLSYKAPKA